MGKAKYCDCGCGVTPTNYRLKFKEAYPTGYPFTLKGGLYYCGVCHCGFEWSSKLHIDHIEPKAKGGIDCIHNLRPLCATCNCSKGGVFTLESKNTKKRGEKEKMRLHAQKEQVKFQNKKKQNN